MSYREYLQELAHILEDFDDYEDRSLLLLGNTMLEKKYNTTEIINEIIESYEEAIDLDELKELKEFLLECPIRILLIVRNKYEYIEGNLGRIRNVDYTIVTKSIRCDFCRRRIVHPYTLVHHCKSCKHVDICRECYNLGERCISSGCDLTEMTTYEAHKNDYEGPDYLGILPI